MQNENIGTCKSATWNRAIPKTNATRKKVYHENINIQKSSTWCSVEMVQCEKSETWKEGNMKNVQHEEI